MRKTFSFNLVVLFGIVAVTLLTGLSACDLLREPRPGAQSSPTPNPAFPVVRVTADQVAQAMEQDEFFADYGQSRLLIQGTVSLVKRQDSDLIIELETSVPTKVICDLGNYFGIIRVGSTVTVESAFPQRDASRQQSAVMLKNCTIP